MVDIKAKARAAARTCVVVGFVVSAGVGMLGSFALGTVAERYRPEHATRAEGLYRAVLAGLNSFMPPVVYVRPDGSCAYVEPVRAGTCDAMPERYETVIVGPEWCP